MADKKNKAVEAKKPAEPVVTSPPEDAYFIDELINASRAVFNVQPEVASAALKQLGKDMITVSEAKAVITKFMNKEVK